jgi:outer membrane protein OmpA-like peptidoglycan-associated protein
MARMPKREKYQKLGIACSRCFGRNEAMHKVLLLISIGLCGCHGPIRQIGHDQSTPSAPVREEASKAAAPLVNPSVAIPEQPKPEAPVETVFKSPRRLSAVIAEVNGQLEDAYFAYDRSEPGAEGLAALRRDAQVLLPLLSEFPGLRVVVEGHCDERGSAEYNLALGDRRASTILRILDQLGVPVSALVPISFGKEMPQCTEPMESCWKKNRRAHLSIRPPEVSSQQ